MFTWREYAHMEETCSHGGNMLTWRKHVHMEGICSHGGNMFTWREYAHMEETCSHGGNMLTWRKHVHMKGICSHEGNMFTYLSIYLSIQCMILGDVFCSISDVNVHVNNDVLVQVYCGVFISRTCLHAREECTY